MHLIDDLMQSFNRNKQVCYQLCTCSCVYFQSNDIWNLITFVEKDDDVGLIELIEQNNIARESIDCAIDDYGRTGTHIYILKYVNLFSALHMAALMDRTATANALIKCGANVNVRDSHRQTPLHLACVGDSQNVTVKY